MTADAVDRGQSIIRSLSHPRMQLDEHRVGFSSTGASRRLKVPALFNLLQDSAAWHIEDRGYGLESLHRAGHAWVLTKQRVRIYSLPGFGESVRVASWQPGCERFYALRDYAMLDEGGGTLAVGTSYWLALDKGSLKIIRPETYLDGDDFIPGLRALDSDPSRLPEVAAAAPAPPYTVGRGDIDMNGHLNNVRYIDLFLSALPPAADEGYELREVVVNYAAQAMLGDRIEAVVAEDPRPAPTARGKDFRHSAYVAGRDRAVCNARTSWRKRDAP